MNIIAENKEKRRKRERKKAITAPRQGDDRARSLDERMGGKAR